MGYSQEEVARRIDTHRTTIGKYENDECEPSIKILSRLIEIYCTDANYILYGKDMKVMNISRVPENCMRDVYMLISEYLIDDYAYNERGCNEQIVFTTTLSVTALFRISPPKKVIHYFTVNNLFIFQTHLKRTCLFIKKIFISR